MVKLNELPPEIVEMVVRVGSDPEKSAGIQYRDLGSFARISPIFQHPSQRVLNERVVLENARVMVAWIKERREEFVVKELEFRLWGEDPTLLEDTLVVRAIRGCSPLLQKLRVVGDQRVDAAILAEENLKNVTSLQILTDIVNTNIPTQLSFPRLKQLEMIDGGGVDGPDYCDGLLKAILGASPSLTKLKLWGMGHGGGTMSEIDLVAEQLESLVIFNSAELFSAIPNDLLQHCAHLNKLSVNCNDLSLLSQILRHLSSSSLIKLTFYLLDGTLEALLPDERQAIDSILFLPPLRNLTSLKLYADAPEDFPGDEVESLDEAEDVRSIWMAGWKEKGIAIEFIEV